MTRRTSPVTGGVPDMSYRRPSGCSEKATLSLWRPRRNVATISHGLSLQAVHRAAGRGSTCGYLLRFGGLDGFYQTRFPAGTNARLMCCFRSDRRRWLPCGCDMCDARQTALADRRRAAALVGVIAPSYRFTGASIARLYSHMGIWDASGLRSVRIRDSLIGITGI